MVVVGVERVWPRGSGDLDCSSDSCTGLLLAAQVDAAAAPVEDAPAEPIPMARMAVGIALWCFLASKCYSAFEMIAAPFIYPLR